MKKSSFLLLGRLNDSINTSFYPFLLGLDSTGSVANLISTTELINAKENEKNIKEKINIPLIRERLIFLVLPSVSLYDRQYFERQQHQLQTNETN